MLAHAVPSLPVVVQAGLQHADGCVYLDNNDRQMVWLRNASVPVPLNRYGACRSVWSAGLRASLTRAFVPGPRCGLPASRRFTFYDQVRAGARSRLAGCLATLRRSPIGRC